MTTVVFTSGKLAVDSRVTKSCGQKVDDRALKLRKVNNIRYKGKKVLWAGSAGTASHVDGLMQVLNEGSGELSDVLSPISKSIGDVSCSSLMLLEDGSGLHLTYIRKDGFDALQIKPITKYLAIGSGGRLATVIKRTFNLRNAYSIAFMASRLDEGSGGNVHYVTVKSRQPIRFKGLSAVTKKSLNETFNKLLEN